GAVTATFNRTGVGVSVEPITPSSSDPDPLKRRLGATITSRQGCGPIEAIELGTPGRPLDAADNTVVDILPNGPSTQASGFRFAPPVGTTSVRIEIYRKRLGSATVPMVVVDGCGRWQTLAGGGPDAFR